MIAKMGIWWWKPWFWEWWWWKRMMVRRRMVMEGKEVISSALLAKIYIIRFIYIALLASQTREKSDQLWEMVHLLSIFSVDFYLIFLTIHTRLHEPHAPNSKIKKSKTNVEYINKHCQFLNGPKNRVLELNCTWNDWLTWTSSWRCNWRKARTPRLRLVLYVQLQLSQCTMRLSPL